MAITFLTRETHLAALMTDQAAVIYSLTLLKRT